MSDFFFLHKLNSKDEPLSLDGAAFLNLSTRRGDQRLGVRYQEVLRLQVHAGVGNYCTLEASEMLQKQLEFSKVLESDTLHGLMFHSCFIMKHLIQLFYSGDLLR